MDKNKLRKIATAIAAAGMLNCVAAAPRNKTITEADKKAVVMEYNKTASTFDAAAHLDTLNEIITSDLNQIKAYDYNKEAEVNNKVAALLEKSNADMMSLAHAFHLFEDNNFAISGLTEAQVQQMTAVAGKGFKDEDNVKVNRMSNAHISHMGLQSLVTVRNRATTANFQTKAQAMHNLDEGDGYNEYYQIITDKRGTRQESNAIIGAMKNNIVNYAHYEYEVTGTGSKEANKIFADNMTAKVVNNLKQIESLVTKPNFNEKDRQVLLKLYKDTARILPDTMFASEEMTIAYLADISAQMGLNRLLTVLATLGYDIENIIPGVYMQSNKQVSQSQPQFQPAQDTARKGSFKTMVNAHATNAHAGTGINLSMMNPVGQNGFIEFGGQFDATVGYDKEIVDNNLRFLGTFDIGTTTKKGNTISGGLGGGVEVSAHGKISTPITARAMFGWQVNPNTRIIYGVNGAANFQEEYADIMASFGVQTKTKNWNIGFFINLGGTKSWKNTQVNLPNDDPNIDDPNIDDPNKDDPNKDDPTKDDPTIDEPTQPTPPVYEEDKTVDQGTSTTPDQAEQDAPTNRGDDILDEKNPGDLSWYQR